MSKKQMPIESDSDFIKNLKKGDKLYTTEYFSAADEVVVNEFTFEQWSKKVTLKEDDDAKFADLKYANSSIKANVDIAYGFFKNPLDALDEFYGVLKEYVYYDKQIKQTFPQQEDPSWQKRDAAAMRSAMF